jgi:hypothetical protein
MSYIKILINLRRKIRCKIKASTLYLLSRLISKPLTVAVYAPCHHFW